ncbi:MAG TPA: aminoglycoside phosphotransferase family protein [Anaerolineales bacterium]|nr:aminoglycoside phosphotransferase family protein [Anaerolineales bacterium]HLO33324.1 aminoglycoside phosphotransferase family protein [Anaerolineales bacterium]
MLEKPEIKDDKIIMALNQNFPIGAGQIEFLPIGNDASAWAYRVGTENQKNYFLKVRKEISNPAGLFVPRFLQDQGLAQVLAPLPTRRHELWIGLEEFFLILYPFVAGQAAMKVGMTDSQWIEFGSILKQIHATELPAHISQYVRRETFIPQWISLTKVLQKRIDTRDHDDPYQKELAAFWRENNETIQTVMERAEAMGKRLQYADLEFVLCHADIHTANILLTQEQDMVIVDWDDTLFAPKERDLMFVLGEYVIPTRTEQLFFDGYGKVKINGLALAYYRCEWCVQEIGDFGERVFLPKELGERTRQDAVKGFKELFSHGDVIETALQTPLEI